ncbi:MAG: type II toxin-antitoxin system RelE/ParE family toxin [Vicingaceae bacterium]
MSNLQIIWTKQAKESLKSIYDYYKERSLQGAKNVKNDILQSPKTIYYSKQYQVDEINPKYRRIIVRDFKVLYKESQDKIEIVDIISSRRSPSSLKKL